MTNEEGSEDCVYEVKGINENLGIWYCCATKDFVVDLKYAKIPERVTLELSENNTTMTINAT